MSRAIRSEPPAPGGPNRRLRISRTAIRSTSWASPDAAPFGVLLGQSARDPVVLADEQGLHGGQLDVLVGPDIAGREELTLGHELSIVRHRQRTVRKVGAVVQGQQVARTGLESAADVRTEGVRSRWVGAVDLRA